MNKICELYVSKMPTIRTLKAIVWGILLATIGISLLNGCSFIGNVFTYKDSTVEFVESLIQEDYTKCVGLMEMKTETGTPVNVEDAKRELTDFRKFIVENWGKNLEYSFAKAEKQLSTSDQLGTKKNTTLILVQFQNTENFGVFQALIDDDSKKILNITALNIKAPIPAMIYFWIFGIFAISVPLFNIYVIWKIKRSSLRRKWIKYVATIVLNLPAVTYSAVGGISFNLLSIQMLFGISFSYMGFLGSNWTFGLPVGGLYCLWKIRREQIRARNSDLE